MKEIYLINKKLLNKRIRLEPASLKELAVNGFMSKVYSARSNQGKLIIHLTTPAEEQKKQNVYEKIYYLAELLGKNKDLRLAKVYLWGKIAPNKMFLVQKFLRGKSMGERIVQHGKILNRYFVKGKYYNELLRFLARLHQIKVPGYGFLKVKDGLLKGEYDSWLSFLIAGSKLWLSNVFRTGKNSLNKQEYKKLSKKLKLFFAKYEKDLIYNNIGKLIHGDMINPGNVLIDRGKISGIIDFEWALSGDPAWEFAFTNQEPLEEYFSYLTEKGIKVDQTQFRKKMKLYRVLWLLWGANVHAKGGPIKDILFKDFKKDLNSLL